MFSVPNTGRVSRTKALLLRCSPASWDLDPSRGTGKVVPGVVGRWGQTKKRHQMVKKQWKLCVSWLFFVGCAFLKWRDTVLWTLKMLAKCYNGSMKYQFDDYDLVGSWWHTLIHAVISYIRIEKIQSKNWRSDGHAPGKKFRQYYHPLVN